MRHSLVGSHVFHDAASGAHNLDSLARVIVGNVERCLLDGLKLVAVLVGLVHDLRATNLELEALAAHRFHKNGQVQNATTGDANAALVFRLVNAHGNVGFLFAHEALFKLRAPTMSPSRPTMGLVEASNTTAMVGSSTAIGFISTGFSRSVITSPMSAASMPITATMSPA